MPILKIELLKDNLMLRHSQMSYENQPDFFLALVSICDELQVEIPIWTMYEERLFERNRKITIPLDLNHKMVLSN